MTINALMVTLAWTDSFVLTNSTNYNKYWFNIYQYYFTPATPPVFNAF